MTLLSNSHLPQPSPEAYLHSQQLSELIATKITTSGGWIDFAQFMHLALYATGLGYYSGGAKKFGQEGDFITAPELGGRNSPSLFAQTLANQAAQVLVTTHGDILELGAGTGRLALDLLLTLAQMEQLPSQYFILEVSADLRETQCKTLQQGLSIDLMQRVVWLDTLPTDFNGLMIANEVLDALPVHIIETTEGSLFELGVKASNTEAFAWHKRALTSGNLYDLACELNLPANYITEICPAATALIASLAECLNHGVLLIIDYGFSRSEYYHAHRNEGTLMCHYRHYAHGDPFLYVGLQDITAHVNFTQLALAGVAHGLGFKGFCSQAQFLINCGITQRLLQTSPHDIAMYAPLAAQAQKLLSPAEMGDLFKVIAFTSQISEPLLGFIQGDKRHTL